MKNVCCFQQFVVDDNPPKENMESYSTNGFVKNEAKIQVENSKQADSNKTVRKTDKLNRKGRISKWKRNVNSETQERVATVKIT